MDLISRAYEIILEAMEAMKAMEVMQRMPES
jgi:hypothetical protein